MIVICKWPTEIYSMKMLLYFIFPGSAIADMMGTTSDIIGRTKQAFVVGQGLTNAGVRLLGEKLANMTIGDISSMFDMKNIDPFLIYELGKQLKDLAKALVCPFLIISW